MMGDTDEDLAPETDRGNPRDDELLDLEVDSMFLERAFDSSPKPSTGDGGLPAAAEPHGARARWRLALPWGTRRHARGSGSEPDTTADRHLLRDDLSAPLGDELRGLRNEIHELSSRVDGNAEALSKELPLIEGRLLHLIAQRFQQLESELELQTRRVAEQSDRGLRALSARTSTLLSLVLLVLVVILFRL